MLTLSPTRITYQGWQVEIVPFDLDSSEPGYCFECYAPNLTDYMDNAEIYPDRESALAAAREFIDREVAIIAFIEQANDWLATGLISQEEYWSLTDFD